MPGARSPHRERAPPLLPEHTPGPAFRSPGPDCPPGSRRFSGPQGTSSCVLGQAGPGWRVLCSSPAARVGPSALGCPALFLLGLSSGSVPCCPLSLRAHLALALSPAPCFGPSPGKALAVAPVCKRAFQTNASTPWAARWQVGGSRPWPTTLPRRHSGVWKTSTTTEKHSRPQLLTVPLSRGRCPQPSAPPSSPPFCLLSETPWLPLPPLLSLFRVKGRSKLAVSPPACRAPGDEPWWGLAAAHLDLTCCPSGRRSHGASQDAEPVRPRGRARTQSGGRRRWGAGQGEDGVPLTAVARAT